MDLNVTLSKIEIESISSLFYGAIGNEILYDCLDATSEASGTPVPDLLSSLVSLFNKLKMTHEKESLDSYLHQKLKCK